MGLTKRDFDWLEQVPAKAKALTLKADGDEQLVDVLGTMNSVEQGLASVRRGAAAEIPAGFGGKRWVMEQGNKATRSYNSTSLINKFAKKLHQSPFKVVGLLITLGAVRLEWHWTNLQKAAAHYNVPLVIGYEETEDGGDLDVGEIWKTSTPKYVRVEVE